MDKPLSRRDFLKLLALVPPGLYMSMLENGQSHSLQNGNRQNVLIVVFDTFSAEHLSFLGYPRETTPNLSKHLEKATVYHNHYAGGNWTQPGTASLLTGTYPWTHRAFNVNSRIEKNRVQHNLFNVFNPYYRVGYSHNPIVNRFMRQFSRDMNFIEPQKDLFIENKLSPDKFFQQDDDIASLTWDRIIKRGEKKYTYSPILARLHEVYIRIFLQEHIDALSQNFPYGLPKFAQDNYFVLEDAIDWVISSLNTFSQPFLGYFHYLPPHDPFNTRKEFVDVFKNDGVAYYVSKPKHLFGGFDPGGRIDLARQSEKREKYDEFILYVDAEFKRLFDALDKGDFLENTWLVFTSDHGEMFERGIYGHRTPALFQPVIKIPLVIFEPGQKSRRDIFTPTSAVDVLPTMLKVIGHAIPDWTEGEVMPPFSDTPLDENRKIYALEATSSKRYDPLGPASVMMVKGKYKLTYYFGYTQLAGNDPYFELYDLDNDPYELQDLYKAEPDIARELRDELLQKVREVDAPYQKG